MLGLIGTPTSTVDYLSLDMGVGVQDHRRTDTIIVGVPRVPGIGIQTWSIEIDPDPGPVIEIFRLARPEELVGLGL